MNDLIQPIYPHPPIGKLISIPVPQNMYAIVIIEFQGSRVKVVTLCDTAIPPNVIEQFNSCYNGVTEMIVLDGSSSPTPLGYTLRLGGYNLPCNEANVPSFPASSTPAPMTLALYNQAGDTYSPTQPSANTFLYSVNGTDPAVPGNDSFGVTIVYQNLPTAITT